MTITNNTKQQSEFETLMSYIKKLRSRYYMTLSSFYAYEGMREIMGTNVVGEVEAQANVEVISNYKDFFMPAQEALRVFFFLELAKLFDASHESLHINKIVNFTASNIKHLTVEAFKEFNQNQPRTFLNDLVKEYRGVAYADLLIIKNMLDTHKESIERLKIYRDKWLVHDDIKKPELPDITGEEIRVLFDVLAKILNSLTSQLNSESSMWDHVERDAKHHTKLVVDHLRRFEPYRLKEIEIECQENINRYSQKVL